MKRNMSYEEKREWIEHTLLNLREGHGSILESKDMRALLMEDREARLIYLRVNQLDSMLESARNEEQAVSPVRARFAGLRPAHLVSGLIGAGIAAAVTLMATLGLFSGSDGRPASPGEAAASLPVASLSSEFDAVIGGEAATGIRSFGEGALSLDCGIAQLAFRNGARIVLEGKCGFEIIDETTVVLSHGKMWAHCPMEARGFKVLTPDGREIVDLGTEFGVEVSPTGETDVHVFDGLVDVVDPATGTRQIEAGEALRWTGEGVSASSGKADFEKFVTASDLAQKRLEAHHARMLARTDLLLYYDFAGIADGKILNRIPKAGEATHGRIHGTTPVSGRVEGKGALQFEHPGDGIALDLTRPSEVGEITIALWVKVDRLASHLSALFNSDGWEPGDLHFQVTRDGNLRAGIHGGAAFESPSGTVRPGKWQMLAVTWDLEAKKARLSCDGKFLPSTRIPTRGSPQDFFDPQFGACHIGSWGERPPGNLRDVRDLKGRIDEVMVFDHALSEEELAQLHNAGSP